MVAKPYQWLLAVVLLIGFLSGCSSGSSPKETIKTQFVCPDGSTVDEPNRCPKPKLIEKILINPTSLDFSMEPGELRTKYLRVTNHNPESVFVECSPHNKVSESPRVGCYNIETLGSLVWLYELGPGESIDFDVRVRASKGFGSISEKVEIRVGTDTGVMSVQPVDSLREISVKVSVT